jgi:MFS family permease
LLNRSTVVLWVAFFATMAAYYFVHSWTPKLLASLGLTAGQGIAGGVLLSVGGIIGTLSFAYATMQVRAVQLTAWFLGIAALCAAVFAATLTQSPANQIAAILLGGFAGGSVAGLYAVAASLYDVRNRTLGVGWALGIGRFGAILSPMVTGILFDRGFSPLQLYQLMVAVFAVAGLALVVLNRWSVTPRSPDH